MGRWVASAVLGAEPLRHRLVGATTHIVVDGAGRFVGPDARGPRGVGDRHLYRLQGLGRGRLQRRQRRPATRAAAPVTARCAAAGPAPPAPRWPAPARPGRDGSAPLAAGCRAAGGIRSSKPRLWAPRCSARGGSRSSGTDSQPARCSRRPADTPPLHTVKGTASSSGSSSGARCGAARSASCSSSNGSARASAGSASTPMRDIASRQATAAAARDGDFQSSRSPVSAPSTKALCASMRSGACSADSSNSSRALPHSRALPP